MICKLIIIMIKFVAITQRGYQELRDKEEKVTIKPVKLSINLSLLRKPVLPTFKLPTAVNV